MARQNGKNVSVRMKFERETKNAVRYQEVDDKGQPLEVREAKIGTTYIKKEAFGGNPHPDEISVTVTWK